jgi:hypothetical protein
MDFTNIIIAVGAVVSTLTIMKLWLFGGIEKRLDAIVADLKDIKKDIRILDGRISHIEGYLMGRDFRMYTDTEK